VWENSGNGFNLIQGDGFHGAMIGNTGETSWSLNPTIAGDGKTIIIASSWRNSGDWQTAAINQLYFGFRVYQLNEDTNQFEQTQYSLFNNYNSSKIETEENINDSFTGSGSTIGQTMPATYWVQGLCAGIHLSYDGNHMVAYGTRSMTGQSGLCPVFIRNSETNLFMFKHSLTMAEPQFGLSYANNRTSGGNNQPTNYPVMVSISHNGEYITTIGNNYTNVLYIFKRKIDGDYEKVYDYSSGAWTGANNSVFNIGQFYNVYFIGTGENVFTAYEGTQRIIKPVGTI
jgi:hypothetical protein